MVVTYEYMLLLLPTVLVLVIPLVIVIMWVKGKIRTEVRGAVISTLAPRPPRLQQMTTYTMLPQQQPVVGYPVPMPYHTGPNVPTPSPPSHASGDPFSGASDHPPSTASGFPPGHNPGGLTDPHIPLLSAPHSGLVQNSTSKDPA